MFAVNSSLPLSTYLVLVKHQDYLVSVYQVSGNYTIGLLGRSSHRNGELKRDIIAIFDYTAKYEHSEQK
jgi:hypothetical protein